MQDLLYSQMLRHNFRPNKKLDQYFIIDKKVIEEVVSLLELKKEDVLLEVGAGTGFLTKEIVSKVSKTIIVEKDIKMIDVIKKEIDLNNTEIINKDFLETNIKEMKINKIVSFVPYSISQEFIYKILNIAPAVLVLQKEFAEKLIAFEGCENYNAISVLVQYYSHTKIKKIISKGSFFPKPNCESAIVVITPKKDVVYSEKFNKFVKTIFRYSKKDLKKAISLSFSEININESKIKNIKEENLKTKVKQLTPKQIKEIFENIKE